MKGLALMIIAVTLSGIFMPIGILYSIVSFLWSSGFKQILKRVGQYLLIIAIAIDQMGNVVMQELFNDILIKPGGHKFGDEDETISSVLGKNQLNGSLTRWGNYLNQLLNLFEKNHSVKSIEDNGKDI